jgi:Fur family ferric uptake transcriptional regulator
MANLVRNLELFCKKNNIKITEQRRTIAKVIEQSNDHPDIEQLYERAKKIDDNISIATLYRGLKLLEDAKLVEKHDFGNGKSRYEISSNEHHDHLIDMKTGEIIEFYDKELENLKVEIAKKLGYNLVDHKLELYAVPKK